MDNGLVQIYSRSKHRSYESLNPCCSGQWSSTHFYRLLIKIYIVLILVVVDNGLVQVEYSKNAITAVVLILVVVDNGLVLMNSTSLSLRRCLVLILVVVDNGLVRDELNFTLSKEMLS